MNFNEQMSEALSLPGLTTAAMPSSTYATGSVSVGPIDMSRFRRAMGIINAGALGASATVTGKFQASAVSTAFSTNVTATTGNSSVTINTANTVGTIEMRADQMPSGTRYLMLVVGVTANTSNVAAELLGGCSEYKPASQYDSSLATPRLVLNI